MRTGAQVGGRARKAGCSEDVAPAAAYTQGAAER